MCVDGLALSILSSLSEGNELPVCMVPWALLSICRVSSSLHLHAGGTLLPNKVMQIPSCDSLLGIEKFRIEKRRTNTRRTQEVDEAGSLCSIHLCFTLSPMNCLLK